jgi:ligand-binding sensor domain-containing protein
VSPAGRAQWRIGGWIALGTVALSTCSPPPLSGQTRIWRPEDRVLITDFSVVDAVAASPWYVYAATRHGLLLYDRRARSWQLPVTSLQGYPAAPVRTALADPAGNAVWLGTTEGWARYDADLERWDQGASPGGVTGLMLDARDAGGGVFLRDASGWSYLPRGAFLPQPGMPLPPPEQRIQPLDVTAALATAPMAQALRTLILTDPQLRSYQFTAAARTPDANALFLGTNGLGLVRLDPTLGQWEPLRFTLLAVGAAAVAPGAEGVWAASDDTRPGGRSGVTWLPQDLSSTTVLEPRAGTGFGPATVRRMLAADGALWLATDAGVFRLDPQSGRTRRYTLGDGLPSEDVHCLAPAPDGVWVGTSRGLAVISASGRTQRVGQFAQPVLSLLVQSESLWVGSAVGLGMLPPGAADVVLPAEVAAEPALRAPIVALARTGDTLVAVLEDQVGWRDPATRRWTMLRPQAALGALTAAAGDAGGVWLGGAIGLSFWRVGRGSFRSVGAPGDLPAPVRDLTVTTPWVWVATDSGVVRLRGGVLSGS